MKTDKENPFKEMFDVHVPESDKALISTIVAGILELVPADTIDPKVLGELLERSQNGLTNIYKLGAYRILKGQHKRADYLTS